jgi:DNA replication protein DnaC
MSDVHGHPIIALGTITQKFVDDAATRLLDSMERAGAPSEDIVELEMEGRGGDCSWCGTPWFKVHALGDVHDSENGKIIVKKAFFGEFDYWKPACHCYAQFKQKSEHETESYAYLKEAFAAAKIPTSEWGTDWGNWDYSVSEVLTKAMMQCLDWTKTKAWLDGAGLILCGPVGVGKTRCAISIAREVIQSHPGKKVRFLPMAELLDSIIRNQTDQGYIEALLYNDMLIVDDLDKISAEKDWARSQVFSFYDSCIREGISLIGTTNLAGPAEMMDKFDYAIVSRIVGKCTFVKFEGTRKDDYRIIRKRYDK